MEPDFLTSMVVILVTSATVVFLLHKLKIPSLVGFLLAGVIIGPHGVGIVRDTHVVEMIAEIGVILLLFTIGIEFSLSRLARLRKAVIGGGSLQISLTLLCAASAAYIRTGDARVSVFFGFLTALSSTAIVLKLLAEKGEIDSPHGRVMVGVLIFQDLCVVPFMLLIPVLAGRGIEATEMMATTGKAFLIIVIVLLSARWAVPRLLNQIVATRSRELFITTIILLCLGIALLTARFGLSLALGAFLAGLIVSESEYAHQATSEILPFKDSFMGIFFVSVGMLMNAGYVAENPLMIGLTVAFLFAVKVTTGSISAMLIGMPARSSIHAGIGTAQIGEFSFVLAVAGKESALISEEFYQIFLSASVMTMMATPFALRAAPFLSAWITSRSVMRRVALMRRAGEGEGFPRKRRDHVIIVGFGLNGKNLARVLKEAGISYVILEMNSDTVREMKKKGEPIYYGDGTSSEILGKMGVEKARLLVVAISDPVSTRRIVSIARHENRTMHIIVRTRYLVEVDELKTLGADEVIPEEFETSIEIFSRVLHQYNFPGNLIQDMVGKIRSGSYTALRDLELRKRHLFEQCEWIPEMEIEGFRLQAGSPLAGKTIGGLQVRKTTGATIIAVRRGPQVFQNPAPDFSFRDGDIILFTGDRESMAAAIGYFRGSREGR